LFGRTTVASARASFWRDAHRANGRRNVGDLDLQADGGGLRQRGGGWQGVVLPARGGAVIPQDWVTRAASTL